MPTAGQLADWVRDARRRTLELVADLTDEQLLGPRLSIVNAPLWELGHVAWFHEKWVLRHAHGRSPLRADGDALYDSAAIPHDTRWDLPLFTRAATLAYMRDVQAHVLDVLGGAELTRETAYFAQLAVFHEDMHGEAFAYTRQTLGYPAPGFCRLTPRPHGGPLPGDVRVAGGRFLLGARRGSAFVFDNEKWAHVVELRPFAIARAPVTQAEFAAFADGGGYQRRELWGTAGWRWRTSAGADQPVYWRRTGGGWERRDFDRWLPLEPHLPVCHVNWYEAEAYCRWAGRRLPTEAEWEAAAAGEDIVSGCPSRFPWGDTEPDKRRASLDGTWGGRADVAAFPEGDSACGCRQLFGNVWEWTASDFLPYPGFEADPYREYSEPWFGTHKVLRGGCWVTRGRLLRNTWRNFYTPDRRDVWAGFRTCAVS